MSNYDFGGLESDSIKRLVDECIEVESRIKEGLVRGKRFLFGDLDVIKYNRLNRTLEHMLPEHQMPLDKEHQNAFYEMPLF